MERAIEMETTELNKPDVSALLGDILTELRRNRDSMYWDLEDIANCLRRSKKTVANHIINQISFPAPIRLPTGDNGGRRLWKRSEVIAWVERFKG